LPAYFVPDALFRPQALLDAVFLESCHRNPDIDWLFFTDCGVPESLPPNVTVESMMFSDYCGLYRRFPYFHFVCWKRNEWPRLPQPDPAEVRRLAAEPAWIIDATGFHRGEL
jgi:hypothetical protein